MIIGICDDNRQEHSYLMQLCDKYGTHTYLHYYSGEELLHAAKLPELVFLDIEMPGINGMEVMQRFEFIIPSPYIIFYTSHAEHCMDAYGVRVIGFLRKPISEKDAKKCLLRAQSLLSLEGFLTLEDHQKVHYSEIQYIQSNKNYAIIHTVNERTMISRTTLGTLADTLPSCFAHIHKSHIVNFYHVIRLENNNFILDDGKNTALPVSRKLKKEIEERYKDFLFENQ